jgi:hypothetical protein
LGEADYFPAAGGQAGDGKCGLSHANSFRGRLVIGLDGSRIGYVLPKRCRAGIVLHGLSPMVRSHMVQETIPFHNFTMLHPGSPHSALPVFVS